MGPEEPNMPYYLKVFYHPQVSQSWLELGHLEKPDDG